MKLVALNYIYLSYKHGGGKDQVGLNLLKGFYENGISKDMIVICFDYSVEVIHAIAPDIKIVSIKSRKLKGEIGKLCEECWVNTFILPRIVNNYKIDVILHLNINNGLRNLGCKSIVIPHDIKAVSHRNLPGLRIPYYKYLLYKLTYMMDFKHADKIIAISETDKTEISKYFRQHKEKIVRVYNPINVNPNNISDKEKGKFLLAINIQFLHKNTITLIKAFELIKDKIEYNLILAGNVPKRVEFLKDYVLEHGLSNRITFTGFISDDEKDRLLSQCRLYINPTLFEGFGMTAVEAVIAKVPTLVSKIGTNYEVTQGRCYYYEPAESERELAKAILKALNEDIYEGKMSEAAQMLLNQYDYKVISKKYATLFNKV